MQPLSEQLRELSDRAKQAEDFVTAVQAKNRAALDSQRKLLMSSITAGTAKVGAEAAAAQDKVQSWWSDARSAVDDRFAAARAKVDEHEAERDAKKAENRAEEAEQDAAYAIQFAISVLDQAEYTVTGAVIARAEADDLAQKKQD